MIILAHDGSICSDWVARYALQFACDEEDRKLLVLHVREGKINTDIVSAKLERLRADCETLKVELITEFLPLASGVYRSLTQAIPHEQDALLVCGTRIKPRRRALLGGSVTEQLLRSHHCPVLALRVVQPGLLGAPQSLLLPLAGQHGGFDHIWPVLQRLVPRLQRIHLFRALYVHHLRHAHLSLTREGLLKHVGQVYLQKFAAELDERISAKNFRVEPMVTISSDWPNAVLVQASRLKVQLLLIGISERNLAHRVLRGADTERVLRESPCDVGIYRGP